MTKIESFQYKNGFQMIHQKTESKSSLEIGALPNRPTEI